LGFASEGTSLGTYISEHKENSSQAVAELHGDAEVCVVEEWLEGINSLYYDSVHRYRMDLSIRNNRYAGTDHTLRALQ
jgi:hypothetical protein